MDATALCRLYFVGIFKGGTRARWVGKGSAPPRAGAFKVGVEKLADL